MLALLRGHCVCGFVSWQMPHFCRAAASEYLAQGIHSFISGGLTLSQERVEFYPMDTPCYVGVLVQPGNAPCNMGVGDAPCDTCNIRVLFRGLRSPT